MEKLNCDIIQDLIPSYVDEVCSEASKTCVEEHLQTCEECRKIVKLCKEHGFAAGGSALATVCWVWLVWHGLSEFTQERNPFELADRDVGPTYHAFMWIFFIVQMVLLACTVKRLLRKNVDGRWILGINLTGIFLLLAHSTLFFRLDSLDYFTKLFNQITVIVLALGMIGTILYAICACRKR